MRPELARPSGVIPKVLSWGIRVWIVGLGLCKVRDGDITVQELEAVAVQKAPQLQKNGTHCGLSYVMSFKFCH